ncbi:putative 5-methylcytosine restriction system,catalytic subunit [Streptococcus sp. GMD4S]|uniref:McrC family protein n=1 Tax=unclassified Streptococcus TaxID=2608887 RepID=UPI000280D592|nr:MULTISPECIES: 3-isopropylmalate dehydrogenase [unclassified Streptococcus]EKA04742.1 putative 5-methylcytosine restriction system,catalytic subunit [Streptococcus sp. GMD6S]EKA12144.1 putative 5-methylcytosine restriction system,catalytic subunit [Streptococcus sp. GMD4S]EKA15501.1 putative 5-methylcytosine restriction system,catalytic subunit [Streptococcus sp. GMD2S]EKA18561.1 putative 5-methylcytosine restriction system,catalytic subunit [Streptococcus sp. GMD1S]
MRITDNQHRIAKEDFVAEYPKLSQALLDRTLDNLSIEDSIFIFPNDLTHSPDLDKDQKIFETVDQEIKTGNVIGFLGCGQEKLTISSRFSDESNDHFLHYLLQKVLNINLTSLDVALSREDKLYQLLMYLFPKYLQAAIRKGLYKEYQRFSHNDSHVKGVIDVGNHLKRNVPFMGNVVYTTREFTYDNPLMQLIRHTIEYIKNQKSFGVLLDSNRENVSEIVRVTPAYKLADRAKIIRINKIKPIRHAYFREYRKLQELCLMILSREKHGLGSQAQKVHGILFDVSWLWEEYVYTLLPKDFIHPRNKDKTDGISVFSNRERKVFPDFYHKELKIVLDAKYKELEFTEKGINREDLFQLISYSYILKAEKGGLVFPSKDKVVDNEIGKLAGYGALLKKFSIQIPQNASSYRGFSEMMESSEEIFKKNIDKEVGRN